MKCKKAAVKERGGNADGVSVALAGNPNVGKSTLFNSLTGMHRHTGNWAGKTVSIDSADIRTSLKRYSLVDIPGTYSLLSHSDEEEIARNYICFGGADITAVVCDATALEHSLALVLQICEVTERVIVCVNLVDEAERCGIRIDTDALSELLGVPVVSTVARKRKTLKKFTDALDAFDFEKSPSAVCGVEYPEPVLHAARSVERALDGYRTYGVSRFWLAMRLIEADEDMSAEIEEKLKINTHEGEIYSAVCSAREYLFSHGVDSDAFRDVTVGAVTDRAHAIAEAVTEKSCEEPRAKSRRADKILTGRLTAFPIMLLFLGAVLWITLSLANYPSAALSQAFMYIEEKLLVLFGLCHAPKLLTGAAVYGVYRTTTTVIAVMLPPMVIFFPLFTLLEDSGYLPRVAYNLDRPFSACGACGKQALTMCMGLGCNAVGITGARIIDSKRERLLAVLTNSFMPCNGRLPMLMSVVGATFILFSGSSPSLLVAAVLILLIVLSVCATFLFTFILSRTVLRGERSSFTIELPPYRRPEFLKVTLNALTTRVAAVLWRAIAVAAPMGLVIFLLSNITFGGIAPVAYAVKLLEPVGQVMGLDGEILLAFVLGLPANEIVLPILVMLYTSGGSFGTDIGVSAMSEIFAANGWTLATAVCMTLFALFHWPCSTSVITVYKETGSKRYTALAVLLPTLAGMTACFIVNLIFKLL